jgi:histidinol-phosphate/aromatic aminotransferase/cobyric acid decarboxylase-like protein
MRKLLVMTMSVTMLIVSSMPMAIGAANCPPPAYEAATAESVAGDRMYAHNIYQQNGYVKQQYGMALAGDWQKDRIECGCGHHNSIDSLPHLLAPHMTSVVIQMTDQPSAAVPIQLDAVWQTSAVRVPLPPPQYLIFS